MPLILNICPEVRCVLIKTKYHGNIIASIDINERVIKDIILTACLEKKPSDYDDLQTDVFVNFDNGDQYVATFFSYKCWKNMMDADMMAPDYFIDNYYRIVLNTVLIKDFNNGNLRPIIDSMIAEGDFQLIFRKI